MGAGFAGLITSVILKNQGADELRIGDKGAGLGGTGYWNQYTGTLISVFESEKVVSIFEQV